MAAGSYQPILPADVEFYRVGEIECLEPASFTAKVGAIVQLSAGVVAEPATPLAAGTIFGFLAEAGHNASAQRLIRVFLALPGVLYEVSVLTALADAHRGTAMGFVKDATSGFWYLDNADTGDQGVVIAPTRTPYEWANGDTKYRALVRIVSTKIQVI